MRPVSIGRRSFVGNNAILPVGRSLGDRCLLGVLSAPPQNHPSAPEGSEWLGSPSFVLPYRQKVGGFDERTTHEPTAALIAQRLLIDFVRILIPPTLWMAVGVGVCACLFALVRRSGFEVAFAVIPAVAIALSMGAMLAVVAVKRLFIGTFKPIIKPLWSMIVCLNEAVNGAYESVMAPILIPLLGTPFCAPWLRLLGCKVGRWAYLETTLFSEFDLVRIGDFAALNAGGVVQNHLFEDRIMKADVLTIGADCSVGNMAVVLYDTEMASGASVGPLSLLMKGEVLPAATDWLGIPTSSSLPHPALASLHSGMSRDASAAERCLALPALPSQGEVE